MERFRDSALLCTIVFPSCIYGCLKNILVLICNVFLIVEELSWLVVANIISSDGTNSLKLSYSYINIVNVLESFFLTEMESCAGRRFWSGIFSSIILLVP